MSLGATLRKAEVLQRSARVPPGPRSADFGVGVFSFEVYLC